MTTWQIAWFGVYLLMWTVPIWITVRAEINGEFGVWED